MYEIQHWEKRGLGKFFVYQLFEKKYLQVSLCLVIMVYFITKYSISGQISLVWTQSSTVCWDPNLCCRRGLIFTQDLNSSHFSQSNVGLVGERGKGQLSQSFSELVEACRNCCSSTQNPCTNSQPIIKGSGFLYIFPVFHHSVSQMRNIIEIGPRVLLDHIGVGCLIPAWSKGANLPLIIL